MRFPPSPNERAPLWCCDAPIDLPYFDVIAGAILGEILPACHVSPLMTVPLLNPGKYPLHLLEVHDSLSLCSRSLSSQFRQGRQGLQLLEMREQLLQG